MSGPYPLTEKEANGILAAIRQGMWRMIAVENLMDLPLHMGSFTDSLGCVLGKSVFASDPPLEIQKENAYLWLTTHYEVISAIFTAMKVLVDDTRDDLEMLSIQSIENHFKQGWKERRQP